MFSNEQFRAFTKSGEAVFFAAVMTKIEGREHDTLLRDYGFLGFPSMAILDAEGEKLFDQIPRSVSDIQGVVTSIEEYFELKAKKEAGETVDERRWFLARLNMGELAFESARKELEALEFDETSLVSIESRLFALKMKGLMSQNFAWKRETQSYESNSPEVVQAVYHAFKAGRRLPAGAETEEFVQDVLIEAGRENQDAEAFFFAFDAVKARAEENIERVTDQLAERESEAEEGDERAARTLESGLEYLRGLRGQLTELEQIAARLRS
ncbi:MAG: hypothetical protein AAF196_00795 [Planctomycetota bacterium]